MQVIKDNFKGILIVISLFIVFALVWVVDVRREHTKNELKDYIDSCERTKVVFIQDIKLELDSIKKDNKTLQNEKNKIKTLSHSALQHYSDSVYRANR